MSDRYRVLTAEAACEAGVPGSSGCFTTMRREKRYSHALVEYDDMEKPLVAPNKPLQVVTVSNDSFALREAARSMSDLAAMIVRLGGNPVLA